MEVVVGRRRVIILLAIRRMKTLPKGLSLVEVVVSVAILGIMVAFGSNFIIDFGNKQALETVRSRVISSLKLGRNYAVSRQEPPGLNGSMTVVGVDFIRNDTDYVVRTSARNANTTKAYDMEVLGKDGEVTVTSSREIYFSALEGKLSDYAGVPIDYQQQAIITIQMAAIGETRTIIVNSNGTINE